jgi:hypothetical protein
VQDGLMATVIFVGVSTAQSLIHRAFPLWAGHLGLDAEIAGVDLPVGTGRADYRRLVEDIRGDADCLGAVVTTHKVALFEAAADRFGTLDDLARSCREINAIRHCGEDLRGFARDPVSVGRVLDTIWPSAHGEVLCLGCGGTAIALGRHLLARGHRGALRFVDRDPAAVARLAGTLGDDRIDARCGEAPWDEAIAGLAARRSAARRPVRRRRTPPETCRLTAPGGPGETAGRGPNGPFSVWVLVQSDQGGPASGGRGGRVDAGLDGVADQFRAPPGAGLVPDPLQMRSHRVDRQEQPPGDLGVGRPAGQQRHDFPFSFRQQTR